MKRKLFFLLSASLCAGVSRAQDLNAYAVSTSGSVTFSHLGGNYKTENPPWTLAGGWHTYFFIDGIGGAAGSSPLSMTATSSIPISEGPFTVASPDGCTAENMFPWRRNYYAITTAQYINHPTAGPIALGILHGENKSMVGTTQQAVDCNGYGLGYPTYAAFVCGSWLPNTSATNWGQAYYSDLGAIVWPSSGYFLANGQKSSLGCGEPSSLQADDGYLYVFYKDMSHYRVPEYDRKDPVFHTVIYHHPQDPDWPYEEGRMGGIKVARVPMADVLTPQAYKSFFQDAAGNQAWNPSLPAGFTKDNTTAFFRTPGPLASDIMQQPGCDYQRFSVAKVAGTNYYFGVGSYQDYNDLWVDGNGSHPRWKISLRYSYDLVHWFGNRVFVTANDWTGSNFNYPIFLSSDGWSNTSINPNDFYIIGTPSNIASTVYKMHFYIPAPPPPPPPPPQICYDDLGRPVHCSDAVSGSTRNGLAATLEMSPAKAPAVYPNPGHGVYQLSYTLKDNAITQLCVLDVTGRRLQAGPTTMRGPGLVTESIDISRHAKGVYMLELTVNAGKKTFKIIYQ